MTLFEECVQALGQHAEIMTDQKTKVLFETLVAMFPVTTWGRIDWDKVSVVIPINNTLEILKKLKEIQGESLDMEVYLLWNYSDAPAVKADIKQVLQSIDDVTAVGSDTWILCPNLGLVIEYFHEGQVTLGIQ